MLARCCDSSIVHDDEAREGLPGLQAESKFRSATS